MFGIDSLRARGKSLISFYIMLDLYVRIFHNLENYFTEKPFGYNYNGFTRIS